MRPGLDVPVGPSIEVTRAWPWKPVTGPLFETGVFRINYKPKQKLPVADWLSYGAASRHLFRPENSYVIEEIQRQVDAY